MTTSRKTLTIFASIALIFGGPTAAFPASQDDAVPDSKGDEIVVGEILQESFPRPLNPDEVTALEGAFGTDGVIFQAGARSSCQSWKNAVAVTSQWFQNTDYNCGLIGTSQGNWNYGWYIPWTSLGGSVCLQGKGYYLSDGLATVYWKNGGCGSSGDVKVQWRSVVANTSIKHKAAYAPILGVGFQWK